MKTVWPGIMAALIARHDIELLGEEIDDLPFALVAPLGAQDDYVSPFCPNLSSLPSLGGETAANGKGTRSSLESRRP